MRSFIQDPDTQKQRACAQSMVEHLIDATLDAFHVEREYGQHDEPHVTHTGVGDKGFHILLDEMPMKIQQLDNNRIIVVACFKGYRAVIAARYLISQGFEKVYALEGGLQKWVLDGRPYSQYN